MIKALLKKELYSVLSVFTMGKDGKRRSLGITVCFAALILYAFGASAFLFWEFAGSLCAPLAQAGMAWTYFAFVGVVATGLSMVLNIFMAKGKLYEARDNDLLLSMPIPSWVILFSRSVGRYIFSFFLESLVFVPAIIRYFTVVGFAVLPFVCSLVSLFLLPLLSLAISYLLGWLIAFLSSKIPGKNVVETVFSIAFLIVYLIAYTKINEYITFVIAYGETVGRVMKTALYPFAQFGYACTGNGVALLLYAFIFIGVFALVYLLMNATYLRLATTNKGSKRVKYTGKVYKNNSVTATLIKKEFLRYSKNGMVLLNCFLSDIFLIILPFIALFEKETFLPLVMGLQGDFSLIIAALVGAMTTMGLYSASCISMEGESLDVVRVLPVKTEKIFLAKYVTALLTTVIPCAFCCIFLLVIFKQTLIVSVCATLAVLLFAAFFSAGGIAVNLLFPNLKWTNEVALVKQSASSLVSMLGGFGVIGLVIGGYFAFGKYLSAWGYLLVCAAFFALALAGVWLWLGKKGKKIFEVL